MTGLNGYLNRFNTIFNIFIFTAGIERHHGRIVYLTYEPSSGSVDRTLYLVGKGVTYDTGGADIKAGGVMAGMSRDKCGAAAVAGFMQVYTYQHCDLPIQFRISLIHARQMLKYHLKISYSHVSFEIRHGGDCEHYCHLRCYAM